MDELRARFGGGEVDPSKFKTPSLIEDGLYLGNAKQASDEEFLTSQLGITHILAIIETGAMNVKYEKITRKQCDLEDATTTKVRDILDECYDFVEGARSSGGKVMIHCASGCSRSPTITVAYLMRKHSWTVDKALAFVQERRKQANPNRSFLEQLHDYEKELNIQS